MTVGKAAILLVGLMLGGCMQSTLEPTVETNFKPRDKQLLANAPYARATMELLQIPTTDELLTAIERAIQAKAQADNLAIDVAANSLFNEAALMKVAGGPSSWLEWFSKLHVRQ